MSAVKWGKVAAGRYLAVAGIVTYIAQRHDGLTWQDPAYWTLTADGEPVVLNEGQLRSRRFRVLADVKAHVQALQPVELRVICHTCGESHVAEYSHEGRHGEGPIYAVVCTADNLTDYYTTEALA